MTMAAQNPTPNTSIGSRPQRKSAGKGNPPFIALLGPPVLRKAIANYKETGELTREDFIGLNWVYGPVLKSAFEIIDSTIKDDDDEEDDDPGLPGIPSTSKSILSTSRATGISGINLEDKPILILQCTKRNSPITRVVVRVTGSKANYYWIPMTDENYIRTMKNNNNMTTDSTKDTSTTSSTSTSPQQPNNNNNIPIKSNVCTCQCISFKWRKDICKHILAALFYLGITPEDEYLETDEEEFIQIQNIINNKSS